MENLDFRPPIIKNIGAAFAAPATLLAAVCFLLAAAAGVLSLPPQPLLLALFAAWVCIAAGLFGTYSAAKNPKGMRNSAPGFLCAVCLLQAAALLCVGAAALLWPQRVPQQALAAIAAAAQIGSAYAAWVLWLLLGLAFLCTFGLGLFFLAVCRTLNDGIPRRRGTGLLCLLCLLTAAACGYIALMYTLNRDFDAVIRFGALLPYNFVPALPGVLSFLGTGLVCITCLRYSGAVKRSNNV